MISSVAEQYQIHPQTLRLYEREGLIKPSRSDGNTRLYTTRDSKTGLRPRFRRVHALDTPGHQSRDDRRTATAHCRCRWRAGLILMPDLRLVSGDI